MLILDGHNVEAWNHTATLAAYVLDAGFCRDWKRRPDPTDPRRLHPYLDDDEPETEDDGNPSRIRSAIDLM